MVTLERSFSREGSLFYCFTWQESNRLLQADWLGFNVQSEKVEADAHEGVVIVLDRYT